MKDNIVGYMNDYLDFCKNNSSLSNRTLKVYRISISKYIDLLNFNITSSLEDIFTASLNLFYDYLLNENYELSTLRVRIIAVRLFLEYLESKEIINNVSHLFSLETMKELYSSERIKTLEDNPKINKMRYTDALNSITELDIKSFIIRVFDHSNKFEYGSKKHQKFTRDTVILIFSYYLGLGCDKLCDLKLKDVIISNNNIIVSVMSSSSKYIIYKLYIYDAFYISIIKRYFEITESLITEMGYFLVNMRSKNKMTESTLTRLFRNYKFSKNGIPIKITSKFLRDLRLLHLLKNNQNVSYIQQLFDYDINILLDRVKYFELHCGLSCNFAIPVDVII